jgi:hypothetical protein
MTRTRIWPPSPSVEDESVSLAKEFGSDAIDSDSSHGIPPAESRGTPDQYPLIVDLDVKSSLEDSSLAKAAPVPKSANSARHNTPARPAPSQTPTEMRFVHIPAASDNERDIPRPAPRPRSKSTIGSGPDEDPRGRPHVSRIQTDLGADLRSMATGARRAPSPYAYRASTSALLSSAINDPAKVSLLSPDSAAMPRRPDASRRARSQHPDRSAINTEDKAADAGTAYHRHRSRSRVDRGSFSKPHVSSGDEKRTPTLTRRKSHSRRETGRSPPREHRPITTHRDPPRGNITPPQTPGYSKESPYTSAAEDSDRRRRHESRRLERRLSKESPTSSTVNSRVSRRDEDERHKTRSRRQSMHRPERYQVESADAQSIKRNDGTTTPLSAKNSRAMEIDMEKAFRENQKKAQRSPVDARSSAYRSPPTSPPRTPGEEMRSRDYFTMTAPSLSTVNDGRRPLFQAESSVKPIATLLGAATSGAAILAAKAMPNLSRSSTVSGDTSMSTASQGSVASAQRSRKPSPVYEEPRPVSRSGSFVNRDESESSRPNVVPLSRERPVSRAGSVASQDGQTLHANTVVARDDRPASRGSMPHLAPMQHPPTYRTSSYSSLPDPAHSRPIAQRTYTTPGGNTVIASTTSHTRSGSSQYIPAAYQSSPLGGYHVPTEKPPVVAALEQKKAISLPTCPNGQAVTGVKEWYTLRGLREFDFEICPECKRALAESSLGEYCVRSSWKDPAQPVACALGRPWIRVAIAKVLSGESPNILLLQELSLTPRGTAPCPGRREEVRTFYQVLDPRTKSAVHGFNVCSCCLRSIELVFPELKKVKLFERPENKLAQEKYCSMWANGKNFYSLANELDRLARYKRNDDLQTRDVSTFVDKVKKMSRTRECARDSMLGTALWHFMDRLPEFTVCEECYETVVWPLRDRQLARDIGVTLQAVKVPRPYQYLQGISCQLYSERMRRVFKDAVERNDFQALKKAALARYEMEHYLQENQRRYALDMKAGYDRRHEIEQGVAYWRQYE